jgi:hypothetical protein
MLELVYNICAVGRSYDFGRQYQINLQNRLCKDYFKNHLGLEED